MVEELYNKVEALLLATLNPLSKSEICEALSLGANDVSRIFRHLEKRFTNTSLELKKIGKKYKIGIRNQYSEIAFRYSESELSKGELEIIGILYNRRNVYFSTVERVRGNKAQKEIDHLVRVGYVEIEQRGTRRLLKLTKTFYSKYGKQLKEKIQEEPKVVT